VVEEKDKHLAQPDLDALDEAAIATGNGGQEGVPPGITGSLQLQEGCELARYTGGISQVYFRPDLQLSGS
jgi:hypothetical protein